MAALRIVAGTLLLFPVVADGAASVSGFSPAFGQPGNVITINGAGFTSATSIAFNNNAPTLADFNIISDGQLQAVVPLGATSGPLEVFVGTSGASSSASFLVAPVITSFTPQSGAPPTMVAVFGANFVSGGTTVFFTGTNTAVSATYVAATEVVATVPAGASNGPITVVTSAGTNVSTNNFLASALPSVTGFFPTVAGYGTNVVIYGGNFFAPTTVKFGSHSVSATITSTTELNVAVPSGVVSGPLTVTTTNGSATTTSNFVTGSGPIITGFSPTAGNSGTAVTINGLNLSSATSVTFNGVAAGGITSDSSTEVQAYPPSTDSGIGPIKIVNSLGSFTTTTNFTDNGAPIVTGFSPALAPVGTQITISGMNFTGTTSVDFGGHAATTFDATADTEILADVPSGAVTGVITVNHGSLSGNSGSNFIVITAAPYIASFTPASGVRGETVTLNGANFDNLSTPAVEFNGVSASYQTPTATTELIATVPATASNGPISVINSGGTGTSSTFFYLQPWITSLNATSGVVNSTLLITGRNLTNASSVEVNGVNYMFTNSPSRIGAVVPTNATTGVIRIATPGGVFISTNQFAILPKIYSFSPSIGPAGTVVTISGTSLFDVTGVEFGGVSGTLLSATTNEAQAAVPAAAKSGPLTVVTPYGNDVSTNSFTATKSSLLVLSKTVNPAMAAPGTDLIYTLAVTNEGPSIVTSVVVTDNIPGVLTFVTASASAGGWVYNNTNLLWNLGMLTNNTSATLQFTATASGSAAVTNAAYLAFAETNLNIDDNTAFAISYIVTAAQQTLSAGLENNAAEVLISWPQSPAPLQLQVNANLRLTNGWMPPAYPVFISNGLNCYTDTLFAPEMYYRLVLP